MTYDHAVKVNGKWYGAGDEVNETSLPASVSVAKPVENTESKEVVEPKKPTTKRSNNKGSKK